MALHVVQAPQAGGVPGPGMPLFAENAPDLVGWLDDDSGVVAIFLSPTAAQHEQFLM